MFHYSLDSTLRKKENLIFMWKDGGTLAGKNQTKQKNHEFPASVENSYPPEEKNK
jgi:hypothetical protein